MAATTVTATARTTMMAVAETKVPEAAKKLMATVATTRQQQMGANKKST